MLFGDVSRFAIEIRMDSVDHASSRLGWGALRVHVGGEPFGRDDECATSLCNSYDFLRDRLQLRGQHTIDDSVWDLDACLVFEAMEAAIFADTDLMDEEQRASAAVWLRRVRAGHLWWSDGDAAFDDGSLLFQMDRGNTVRLIAGRSDSAGRRPCLRSVDVRADTFYGILQECQSDFESRYARLTPSGVFPAWPLGA